MNYIWLTYLNDEARKCSNIFVGIDDDFDTIPEYKNAAAEKLAKTINVSPDKIHVIDYKFLGDDLVVI